MKRVIATIATASGLMLANSLFAQEGPAPMPPLTEAQSQQVQSQMESYRRETDARVSRGEITPDEAQRLLQWREWQLAQLAAGIAPAPPPPRDRVVVSPPVYQSPPPRYYDPYPYYYPAPYYAPVPYYAPYYAPYYGPGFGLSVCAGRAYRHGFGSFCI